MRPRADPSTGLLKAAFDWADRSAQATPGAARGFGRRTHSDPRAWAYGLEVALAERRLGDCRYLLAHRPARAAADPLARADALSAEAGFLLFDHATGRAELALRDADSAYERLLPDAPAAASASVFHALVHRRFAELYLHQGRAAAGLREVDRALALLGSVPTRGRPGAWALAVRGALHGLRAEIARHRFDLGASDRDWAEAVRSSEAAVYRWPRLAFAGIDAAAARTQLAYSAVWGSQLRAADRELARALVAIEAGRGQSASDIRPHVGVARTLLLVARLRVLELRMDLAHRAYRDAELGFARALELQPGSPVLRAEMGEALAGQAVIGALSGRPRPARRRLDAAVRRARDAVALAPQRPELRSTLTRILLVRSAVARALEPAESPFRSARAALESGRRTVRLSESDSRHRRDLANALRAIGRLEARVPARHGAALRHLNEAASILSAIVAENPRDAPARARRAVVLSDLMAVAPASSPPRQTRRLYDQALTEIRSVEALLPTGFFVAGLFAHVRRAYATAPGADLGPRDRVRELERSRSDYADAHARAPGYLPALWGIRSVSSLLADLPGREASARRDDRARITSLDAVLARAGIRPGKALDELDPAGGFLGLAMR